MAAEISRGTRVPRRPRYPGTEANIGRGTQGTTADFSRGTLWLDQSEAQEFWGLLIGRAKGTAADFGLGTRVPRPKRYPGTAADISLGTRVPRLKRYPGTAADFGRQFPPFL